MSKSNTKTKIWVHKASGQWAKKHHGKTIYLGKVADDPKGVLARQRFDDYLVQLERAEQQPEPVYCESATVGYVCNYYLHGKQALVDSGERSECTLQIYKSTCKFLIEQFGRHTIASQLTAEDFRRLRSEMLKRWKPSRVKREVGTVKAIFTFCVEDGILPQAPKFGRDFRGPAAKLVRQSQRGECQYDRATFQRLLAHADATMTAIILLTVNAGLGNTDLCRVKPEHVKDGWLELDRQKTGIHRRVPLWPETVSALAKLYVDEKTPYVRSASGRRVTADRVKMLSRWYTKLCRLAGVREHQLYDGRRTLATLGENLTGDVVAVSALMGHTPKSDDMSAIYRQRISDERLQRVTETVRAELVLDNSDRTRLNVFRPAAS